MTGLLVFKGPVSKFTNNFKPTNMLCSATDVPLSKSHSCALLRRMLASALNAQKNAWGCWWGGVLKHGVQQNNPEKWKSGGGEV
jgi:hypothetical protein